MLAVLRPGESVDEHLFLLKSRGAFPKTCIKWHVNIVHIEMEMDECLIKQIGHY